MNPTTKLTASALLGAMLSFGATTALVPNPDVVLVAQKHEILKDYVFAQARLNEIPQIDLSVVSAKEYTAAYASLITEKNVATPDTNLFIDLQLHAVKTGVACKI